MNMQLISLIESQSALKVLLDHFFDAYSLSLEQYVLLEQIAKENEKTPTELAAELKVSKTAISRRCRLLGEKGYIYRLRRGDFGDIDVDSRMVEYYLTDSGEELLLQVDKDIEHKIDILKKDLGEVDWQTLVLITKKINKELNSSKNINSY